MSELFDEQVNVQKESLKKICEVTQAPTKVCNENDAYVQNSSTNLGLTIPDTVKVLFVK